VAELEHRRHDPGFIGAVAVAPASRLNEVLAQGPSKGAGFYVDYLAWAVAALSHGFDPSQVLTGAALTRYPSLTRDGCFYFALASFQEDTAPPTLKPGWTDTPAAQRFFAESMVGAPVGGPLLVVAGDADQAVPLAAVRASSRAACQAGAKLELRVYPGLDHDPTMENSTPDQLAWIHARFDGQPAGDDCAKVLAGSE
jgi:alpha-beta hydrolase superfamily lysophospholipase